MAGAFSLSFPLSLPQMCLFYVLVTLAQLQLGSPLPSSPPLSPSPISHEVAALLAIRSSLVDPLGHLRSWTVVTVPSLAPAPALSENAATSVATVASSPCRWAGVSCDSSGSVVALDLTSMDLSGTLAGDIGRLTRLVNLTLSLNELSGRLPADKMRSLLSLRCLNISNNGFNGSLPAALSELQSLEVLDVYNNNFSGSLPPQLSRLPSLRHLHLGGNFFQSGIPPQYGNLQSLTYLALSGNSLTGRIPPELANLARLQYLFLGYFNVYRGGIPAELGRLSNLIRLDIAYCNLTGSIPPELGNLSKLDSLFLQVNSLTGPIPPQLGNLTQLKSLDLSNNALSGEIPGTLAGMQKLELLSMFRNELHGPIPDFVGNLPSLQVLFLWDNNMTGPVPQHLGENGQLLLVDLSSNSFSGLIPPNLCKGRSLRRLILLDNLFSGSIPDTLGDCPLLERIRLGQNMLNGSIPASLFKLPVLEILEVPSNRLTANLPLKIPQNHCLGRMDFSNNLFDTSIPASLGNLQGLETLLMSGNQMPGQIPPEIGSLKHLSKLDLHENHLSSYIPPEMGDCKNLAILDLSGNDLSGEIPSRLADLAFLELLNVSRNQLSGRIPSALQDVLSLTAADFSYNQLSGPIPGRGQLVNFNSSVFIGNPGLCGLPLPPCELPSSSPSGTSVRGIVALAIAIPLAIVIFLGVIIFNRQALSIWLEQMKKAAAAARPWKFTAFQRLDFDATNVSACLADENIIGKGGAGVVYKGIMPNGQMVAVKRLTKGCSSNDRGFSAEIQTLGKIRHRHIVRLLGSCSNHDTNLLVYEYMPNGSLGELLHGPRATLLDWANRYRIAVEAAKGLCYLHHDCFPSIVHRDVKSNNILLDSNYEAHVADFGLAKVLQESGNSECMSSVAGSYGYIAPEYGYTLKVDKKSDIYSFGVVLLELLTGRRPLEPEYGDGVDIVQWVRMKVVTKEGTLEVLDSRMGVAQGSNEMTEVMLVLRVALLCLEDLPIQRPMMREVVQMLTDVSKNNIKAVKHSEKVHSPPDLISI